MLRSMSLTTSLDNRVLVFDQIASLPVFSPDLEATKLPEVVENFAKLIREADGIIIASPEYIRAIPGGLKNAIDWLVSRDEIIAKPVALMHASHRGDDMLEQLRLVLSTVSERFRDDIFLRFHLMNRSPEEVSGFLQRPENQAALANFIREFTTFCRHSKA